MNFPSQIFLNDINHGYRSAKKNYCGCFHFIWLWLRISMMKTWAERCVLQLYQTSLKRKKVYFSSDSYLVLIKI